MFEKELIAKVENYIKENEEIIIKDWMDLIRINSVSDSSSEIGPFGENCRKALDKALDICRRNGLEASNHDYYYGTAASGNGDKTIGLFSHLDVVPVSDDWIYSPFEPQIVDGHMIGRGCLDNKSGYIASMYAIKCVRDLGLPVKSRLMLFMGCSEETGMQDITRFVSEQPMPDFCIVPDTSFPVCHGEKGIMEVSALAPGRLAQIKDITAGQVSNMVPGKAVAVIPYDSALAEELFSLSETNDRITLTRSGNDMTVTAVGISSHAAHPEGSLNATKVLCEFLCRSKLLNTYDRAIVGVIAKALSDDYGRELGIGFSDEPSGYLTCVSGMIRVIEGRIKLSFNIRYPVTVKGAAVSDGICKYFSEKGWSPEVESDSAPCYIPADDPKVQVLSKIYAQVTGLDATPYVMGGGTYSRYLKNSVSFGPESHMTSLDLPAGHGGAHQPDECMNIAFFMNALKIYILSIIEVDKLLNK